MNALRPMIARSVAQASRYQLRTKATQAMPVSAEGTMESIRIFPNSFLGNLTYYYYYYYYVNNSVVQEFQHNTTFKRSGSLIPPRTLLWSSWAAV